MGARLVIPSSLALAAGVRRLRHRAPARGAAQAVPALPAGPPAAARPPGASLRKAETLGEPKKEKVAAVRIDNEIMLFALQQRQARFTSDRGIAMPPAVRSTWSEVLGRVDLLLRAPADKVLPLDLVRARVALEAELELDKEHYLAMPDGLTAGVLARTKALDQRLAEIRALQQYSRPVKRFYWPIDPVIVTSMFGWRADPIHGEDREHKGIDLKAELGQRSFRPAPRARWSGRASTPAMACAWRSSTPAASSPPTATCLPCS
jgi:murein DD-endopeptidase MepM/ murein hydrolase activator NlpD